MVTYFPFWTSYPRTTSCHGTSFPSFGHTRLNERGLLSRGHIRRSPVLCSEIAPYVLTGMLTSPKLIAPFQIALGGKSLHPQSFRTSLFFRTRGIIGLPERLIISRRTHGPRREDD